MQIYFYFASVIESGSWERERQLNIDLIFQAEAAAEEELEARESTDEEILRTPAENVSEQSANSYSLSPHSPSPPPPPPPRPPWQAEAEVTRAAPVIALARTRVMTWVRATAVWATSALTSAQSSNTKLRKSVWPSLNRGARRGENINSHKQQNTGRNTGLNSGQNSGWAAEIIFNRMPARRSSLFTGLSG